MVAKRAHEAQAHNPTDKDYTIPALIALVGIVLITALFFAQPNVAERASLGTRTVGGNAYAAPATGDQLAPAACAPSSICDGSKLIRTQVDCTQFEAFCSNGCDFRASGATCL